MKDSSKVTNSTTLFPIFRSSVKRYINDNQGLVRRMYGDEKHSSVLLNEIDGFQLKFDQLRSYMTRDYSRTEYGRSARGSRRQPRPQIFQDDEDDETPATIFRVVTETSIKVGEPLTQPITTTTTTPLDEASTMTATTQQTNTETLADTTYTTAQTTTTSAPSTTESTTTVSPDRPVAMERIGYGDGDDYDYMPDRKSESAVLQNSVGDKSNKYKQEASDVKRNDPPKYDDESSLYEGVATDEPVDVGTETKSDEEEVTEEIPRRGM